MGVLNFESHLKQQTGIHDIISLDESEIAVHNNYDNDVALPESRLHSKRKRTKCIPQNSYDFRNHGVDQRRRSAKHKRRRENLIDLLEFVGEDNVDDVFETDDYMTVFAELFMNEDKMKLWENFINLPEEKQRCYLDSLSDDHEEDFHNDDMSMSTDESREESCYMSIDKKIRDMLLSKKLAHQGLLEYYEEDMRSCIDSSFPTILVMNLSEKYDRMLVYAVCQYLGLPAETIRLKDSTLMEIDVNRYFHDRPSLKLIEYLKQKKRK